MNIGIETELVEFKKTTGELKEGMISIASMLNKNGKGVLYFGVRNDGEIVGQQIGDRTRGLLPQLNHRLSRRSLWNYVMIKT